MNAYDTYWLQFDFGNGEWKGYRGFPSIERAVQAVRDGLGIFPARIIMGGKLYAKITPDGMSCTRFNPGVPLAQLDKKNSERAPHPDEIETSDPFNEVFPEGPWGH